MKRLIVCTLFLASACRIEDSEIPDFGGPCVGSGGCPSGYFCNADLNVCQPGEPPPPAREDAGPAPPPPDGGVGAILTFTINDVASVEVEPGDVFTLQWTTRDVDGCNIAGVSDDLPDNGEVEHSETTLGPITYTLTCTGPQGAESATVDVFVLRIVEGDLRVANDSDLEAVAGVSRITGSLIFEPTATVTDVAPLASLEEVLGNVTFSGVEGLATLDFPALRTVGGTILIDTCAAELTLVRMDALETVGNDLLLQECPALATVSMTNLVSIDRDFHLSTYFYPNYPETTEAVALTLPNLASIDFNSLQTVGRNFDAEDLASLTNLTLPALREVTASLIVWGLGEDVGSPSSISFPALETVGTLLILENRRLASFSAPNLTTTLANQAIEDHNAFFEGVDDNDPLYHVYRDYLATSYGYFVLSPGDIHFWTNGAQREANDALQTIEIGGLVTVGGTLSLHDAPIESFDLPLLERARGIQLALMPGFTSFTAPSLTTIGDDVLHIQDMPDLVTLSLPALTDMSTTTLIFDSGPGSDIIDLDLGATLTVDRLELHDTGATALSQLPFTAVTNTLLVNGFFPATSLAGLEGLTRVGSIELSGNNLTSVAGLDNLATVDGVFRLGSGLQDLTVFDGPPALTSIGSFEVFDRPAVIRFPALTTITNVDDDSDSVDVSFVDVTELSFPALQTMSGGLFIAAPVTVLDLGAVTVLDSVFIDTNLTNVDMFCGVTRINEDVSLRDNEFLQNLGGFGALTAIGTTFSMFTNGGSGQPNVALCEVRTLLDQTGATPGTISPGTVPALGCPLPDTCNVGG